MKTKSLPDFVNGLVFGFDVGTGSIGYAARRGSEWKDVGVLICPEDTNNLSGRRGLRRQRRTLRSRSYRRKWFAKELEKLGFPRPDEDGRRDPVTLRVCALSEEKVSGEEMHAALAHLFRRRGYTDVPWKQAAEREDADAKKHEGEIQQKMSALQVEMKVYGFHFPCELLKWRSEQGRPRRREVWPRELLCDEFLAIVDAQKGNFPQLTGNMNGKPVADWLLYGDTDETRGHHVFFKSTVNPGVLGLRWPRFDNRGPALDSFTPVDATGRPLHVVRKNKSAFAEAQWELAVMNFRVIERATGKLVAPGNESLHRLRTIWELSRRKSKKKTDDAEDSKPELKISEKVLDRWAAEFSECYKLVEGQKPLAPQSGAGRARYSSPTLAQLKKMIDAGQRIDPPQPILRREGEDNASALDRYLSEIKHPLVRHRLVLFRGLLAELRTKFGMPDMIVIEGVRSLALSQKKKNELSKRNEQHRKERENARDELTGAGESGSRRAIQRFRLWQEAKGRCPFCLQAIARTELGHSADIEHLVPRAIVDCNEWYNLTVAHLKCNREIKGDRIPFTAFHGSSDCEGIRANAEQCFRGRKLEIFLSPQAEELIEQKIDIQHTAYIARVLRHVALLQLNWLGKDGRDPTIEKGNKPSSCFQVTNGSLTSRLREKWGLNEVLHPLPPGKRREDLTDQEREQMRQKNRGDLRHHALDAMVIACTLPWLAHRTHGATDEFGNHGWWTQDEKQRSKAANPVGLTYEKAKAEIDKAQVRHHVSRSPHQQAYATTLYAKKAPNTYVAREVFTTLTPEDLKDIWPVNFATYCVAAWSCFCSEFPEIEAELKILKKKNRAHYHLPEAFTNLLCFSHFQKWQADGAPEFQWPAKVKIAIRSVRLISLKDDTAVAPFSAGTNAFVKRTGFREVRIYPSEDGKNLVPVFIPYWKGDKPISTVPFQGGASPIAVLRRGQIVDLKKAVGSKGPPGRYRIVATMQDKPQIIPSHIARDRKALLASGFFENGVNVSWPVFLNALGYEPPYSSSAQPESSASIGAKSAAN